MTTREEFLRRIGAEVRRAPGLFVATTAPRPGDPQAAAAALRRQLAERWPLALKRFQEEFERVGGVMHRARTAKNVPEIVAAIAREREASSLVAWSPGVLGLDLGVSLAAEKITVIAAPAEGGEAVRRQHRDAAARAGIGVTGADVALAETGTIIVGSGPGRPRTTSLLPETHVAVFDRHRLVESLDQVGVILEALHAADGPDGGVINFITGPSRTADIELTLTRGVHGPKYIQAVFVEDGGGLSVPPIWGTPWPP
jgi:L-lactate dehydrogenase complex protein LldG